MVKFVAKTRRSRKEGLIISWFVHVTLLHGEVDSVLDSQEVPVSRFNAQQSLDPSIKGSQFPRMKYRQQFNLQLSRNANSW